MVRCVPENKPLLAGSAARLKVAVIGTGIAGETAAYFLAQSHHVAALYEAGDRPGLHSHSIDLPGVGAVDVPIRAFSSHYYPNLMRLYAHLGVKGQPVNYSSTGLHYPANKSYFQYSNVILMQRAIPFVAFDQLSVESLATTARIVRDLLWYVFTSPYYLRWGKLRNVTLGEHLQRSGYSFVFVSQFLYPVMSSLLSCSTAQVSEYPADLIAEFFCSRATTIFAGWFRLMDGVKEVSTRLLGALPPTALRLGNKVRSVAPSPTGKGVVVVDGTGREDTYDAVVIATEPHVAATLLGAGASTEQKRWLQCVSTFTAEICVHHDTSLLPSDRSRWSSMNYYSCTETTAAALAGQQLSAEQLTDRTQRFKASMVSALVNKLVPAHAASTRMNECITHEQDDRLVIETWNPFHPPRPETVVSRAYLTRAVWTVEGRRQFEAMGPTMQGHQGVFFCGSYCSPGVTLLEQAVHSALDVASDFGVVPPWAVHPTYEPAWWSLCLSHVLVVGRRVAPAVAVAFVAAEVSRRWFGVALPRAAATLASQAFAALLGSS